MSTAVFTTVLMLFVISVGNGGEIGQTSFRETSLDNVMFTSDLQFTSVAISAVNCGLQCSEAENCVMFTFTPLTGMCRGHGNVMNSESPNMAASGSRTYVLLQADLGSWEEKLCATNAECPAVNSECFEGRCLCTPGYFYSHSLRYCVASCATADLQDTFLRYPTARMYPNSGSTLGYGDEASCHAWCVARDWCVTIEYFDWNRCIGEPDTPLDLPDSWAPSFGRADFYQRTCA